VRRIKQIKGGNNE